MVRVLAALAASVALMVSGSPTSAAEFGTRDEAVAMVKRVQDKLRKDGPEATFEAVTAKTREFHDRDLYVFIHDLNGISRAHGGRAELVGKNLIDFKDQDGKFVVQDMIDLVRSQGHGWVDYRWMNPKTNTVESKSAYVERMGDLCVGVGVYRDEQVNENTVAVISGSPSSDDTNLQMAYDLAAVLNDGENLRILPVVGIGGPQNIRDVRGLRGIDIGLTQTSVLNNFRRSNEQLGSFDDKIVYITKLFNEEAHLLVRSDITLLEQLQGRKVNLDENGSGTNYSARDVLRRLNIKVEEVALAQTEAIEKLRRGEIAATVLIAGKPARSMSRLGAADGLHLLSIPYSTSLGNDYLPAMLTHDDYPNLVPPGGSVDTVAVGAVLIAYNWPKNTDRYRRVEKFVNAFFPRIAEFQRPPRHVKWREVNLATRLPGWTRFGPAEAWLAGNREQETPDPHAPFNAAVAASATTVEPRPAADVPAPNAQLFEDFLKWKHARPNP